MINVGQVEKYLLNSCGVFRVEGNREEKNKKEKKKENNEENAKWSMTQRKSSENQKFILCSMCAHTKLHRIFADSGGKSAFKLIIRGTPN